MEKIRTLVVDDSAVFRSVIAKALSDDPDIEVVGAAPNGEIALKKIASLRPNFVVLDVEMPVMDGIETLRRIRAEFPAVKVIMFSAHTRKGAASTIDALSLGAVDFVTKPGGGSAGDSSKAIQSELVPKIRAFLGAHYPGVSDPPTRPRARPPRAASLRRPLSSGTIVAIGVSTGGPNALRSLLSDVKAGFPFPIVIAQHMPPIFTAQLADRLNRACPLEVVEAKSGQPVRPGNVYIAPGDFHMEIVRNPGASNATIRTHQGPKECSCRPSVDVLFRSVADSYGANTIAVVLTGMGRDGLEGAKILKGCDARVIAQEKASCTVYGMPRFIVEADLADEVLPLDAIAPYLMRVAK